MFKYPAILIVLAIVTLLAIGVDLAYQRAGIGLIAIGSVLVLGPWLLKRDNWGIGVVEVSSLLVAGSYFVWRGWFSESPSLAFADGVLLAVFFGAYLATRMLKPEMLKFLVYGVITLGVVNVGFAIYQYNHSETPYVFREGVMGDGSLSGLFGHYNYFAAMMNTAFMLSLALIADPGRRLKAKIGFLGLCVLFFVAIYYSGSRGGWLSFVVGIIGFFTLYAFHLYQRKNPLFKVILGLMLVLFVFGTVTITQKFEHTLDLRSNQEHAVMTDGGRLVFQQWAFDFFLMNPWTGNGPRAFDHLSQREWNLDDLNFFFPNPDFVHNEYLQILCDYGFIGFLILVLILFIVGVRGFVGLGFSEEKDKVVQSHLLLGGMAALLALLIQCLFSFLAHGPTFMALLALLMAIIVGGCHSKKQLPLLSKSLVSLGGLVVTGVGVILVISLYFQQKGKNEIKGAETLDQELAAVEYLNTAALIGVDSLLAEDAGLQAHQRSLIATRHSKDIAATKLRKASLESFELALELNPYSLVALCAKARLLDEAGEYEAAYKVHLQATKAAWAREYFLRPHYQAAINRAMLGLREIEAGKQKEAEEYFAQSLEFIERGNVYMRGHDRNRDSVALKKQLIGWLSFYQAQRLYKEGDVLWKKRDPERGLALMLLAREKYRESQQTVQKHDPLWKLQWDQLKKNIAILERANIQAAEISPAEIERIAKGLETLPVTR